MKKLTQKQRVAAEARVKGATMADAYRKAYSTENMTEDSVRAKGCALFNKSHVAAYLETLQEHAEQEAIMDRKEALKVLSEIGRGGLHNYLDENGSPDPKKLGKPGRDLLEAEMRADDNGVTRKVKARDPVKAIERLAKMQGWDSADKLEVEGIQFQLNMGGEQENG